MLAISRQSEGSMAPRNTTYLTFPDLKHNHANCIADALDEAEGLCRQRGLRFTPLRRRVLEIVWNRHAPTGAYDILEALGDGKRPAAPPTVYRTLEFLLEYGFVHKIESLNAFIGCGIPGDTHAGQFLSCGGCRQVGELDDPEIAELISQKAAEVGFAVTHPTVEVKGLCKDCAKTCPP